MISSNYSRRYYTLFPAYNPGYYYDALGVLDPENETQNVLSAPMVYSDSTKTNFRQVTFSTDNPDGVDVTLTGYSLNGWVTENITVPAEGTDVSTNYYWYLTSILINPNLQMTIGSGDGYSMWIAHDGSKFKNVVNMFDGTGINWTVEASDEKFFVPFSGGFAQAAPFPFDVNAQPYNIAANLTTQNASTTYPIYVEMPVEAFRIKVVQTTPETPSNTYLTWSVTTQNIM